MVIVGEYGIAAYKVDYEPQPVSQIGQFGFTKGVEFAGSPSEEELSNKLFTGPYPTLDNDKPQDIREMPIAMTYIPGRQHLWRASRVWFWHGRLLGFSGIPRNT